MRWDSSRPVPWQRLMREWVIYAAIISAIFLIVFRDDDPISLIAGVLASGPIYLLVGTVLAKFGYQRKTLKELRTPRSEPAAEESDEPEPAAAGPRQRPSPSRRTSAGHNNPNRPKRKRK